MSAIALLLEHAASCARTPPCYYFQNTSIDVDINNVSKHGYACETMLRQPFPRQRIHFELFKEGERGVKEVLDSFVAQLAAYSTVVDSNFVLDVGANDGSWSRALFAYTPRALRPRMQLHLFEPQPYWRPLLTRLAARQQALSGTTWRHWPVAAWVRRTQLNFTISRNLQSSSVVRVNALRYGVERVQRVEAIDLAHLIDELRAGGRGAEHGAMLLKIDIEAGEYALLPHLLATGALCKVTHLIIEWHLNALPPSRRLAGLALRHSLDATLRDGCATPPRDIAHVEYTPNNGAPVEGLAQLVRAHSPDDDEQRASLRKWDEAHLKRQR